MTHLSKTLNKDYRTLYVYFAIYQSSCMYGDTMMVTDAVVVLGRSEAINTHVR